MCVVALALNQHPDWPIIMIGNRDEFHARVSAPLHAWNDGSGIIAGRDLVGGGTWLGVQPALTRLVVVTNVRSGAAPDGGKASRGVLVTDMLADSGTFADPAPAMLNAFNGFSLLSVAGDTVQLFTNRPAPMVSALGAGVHALANEAEGSACPRAARLGAVLASWVTEATDTPESLFTALQAKDAPALFLCSPVYGTRCSTLVAINRDGGGQIIERRYDKGGILAEETALEFQFG